MEITLSTYIHTNARSLLCNPWLYDFIDTLLIQQLLLQRTMLPLPLMLLTVCTVPTTGIWNVLLLLLWFPLSLVNSLLVLLLWLILFWVLFCLSIFTSVCNRYTTIQGICINPVMLFHLGFDACIIGNANRFGIGKSVTWLIWCNRLLQQAQGTCSWSSYEGYSLRCYCWCSCRLLSVQHPRRWS